MPTLLPARPLPPKVYTATIVSSDLASFAWRRYAANPLGLTLRLVVEIEDADGEPAHVTDAVDVSNTGRLASVFKSAGIDFHRGDDPADRAPELIGTSVLITTKNVSPSHGLHAGRLKAVIGSWIEQPQ